MPLQTHLQQKDICNASYIYLSAEEDLDVTH